ncbi:MAG TPA: type II CAAX endopeptidase family protein [Acidobacteriaceae bacterium]|nr:type II CAAX endopeptidase family protein [Acidobacteriaceae bacterium]
MTAQSEASKLRTIAMAILYALLIFGFTANVWPIVLLHFGVPLASCAEVLFLAVLVWWASGGGPPRTWKPARAFRFRATSLNASQWAWVLLAAVFFAVTVHASIVLLFRFVSFPLAQFRRGYSFSFIPTVPLRWLAIVISAASAGICEEIGFRGYMQRPIERSVGSTVAILISSTLFMLVHLTKSWASIGMVPIVLGAGILLGLLAWSSNSLIPCMIGHTIMDVGLFAYWWTGVAGDFTARPIHETGIDSLFIIACFVFVFSLLIVLLAISKLRAMILPTSQENPNVAAIYPS